MPLPDQPTASSSPPALASAADSPPDPFAEILALARKNASPASFLTNVMRCLARYFASPYTAIHVRYASEVVQDDWHTGPTDPQFWKTGLQQYLTEALAEPSSRARLLQAKTGAAKVAFLSTPIFNPSGNVIGAIALVLAPAEENEVPGRLATLEALARLASYAAEFLGGSPWARATATSGPEPAGPRVSAPALARAASCTTPEELAFAITNDLCNKLGCEQVALGMVAGRRVKVLSISGMDVVRPQSPGVVSLRSAMEECLDADTPIVYQDSPGWSSEQIGTGHRLHKQWHAAVQGNAVASIPLHVNGRLTAILSLRKRKDEPFTPDQIADLRARVEPLIPALQLTQRAGRSLVRHATNSVRDVVESFGKPDHLGRKIISGVAVLIGLWFAFGSINYDLTVPCVIRPAQIRHITAPFDAVLASATVIEGDYVKRGDVLCELDHRDLDQQRAELLAELAVLERTRDRAMADDSPVEVQLALANQELVRAKLDIVERRIEQAVIRAPMDGVIVAGDLRKLIGSVVARGDPFFEVAPLDNWTLELEVPESASADLSLNLAGLFASYARPDETREFRVSRVLPEAQIRQGRNAYVAEARVDTPADWIRPGMEGVAKIHLGPRRVWWITLHRAVDYVRMNLWL